MIEPIYVEGVILDQWIEEETEATRALEQSTTLTFLHPQILFDGAGAMVWGVCKVLGNDIDFFLKRMLGAEVQGEWRIHPAPGPYKADGGACCQVGGDLAILLTAHEAISPPRLNIVALAWLRGVVVPHSAAAARALPPPAEIPLFTDVPAAHPLFAAVQQAAALGIISGYADHTFRPNVPVTRAQAAKMLTQAVTWR